jgi:hypothetical protein
MPILESDSSRRYEANSGGPLFESHIELKWIAGDDVQGSFRRSKPSRKKYLTV